MREFNMLSRYPKGKRNLVERAAATDEDRAKALLFDREYFDGERRHGYGGYTYDGRWLPVAETFVKEWGLKAGDRVLDIGCAKGFLVKDLMKVCPGLEVFGVDISRYALMNCDPAVIGRIHLGDARALPFPDKSFSAAISINTIHNLERTGCVQAIQEMQRVAPEHGYIQVDSYRTEAQRQRFLNWVLTAKTYDYPQAWEEIFREAGYSGDYSWTILE
jgi:ubiquinone/menaquinone biosynthesis C-methylase UbiE